MPPTRNKTDWTPAHQKRYNAIYGYLTKSLHLDINKDDFVNTMNKRLLFKYIMENPKWAESTKENYLFGIARKLNILKNYRQAKWFSEQAHELQVKRGEEEGLNGLDLKEQESWRPHQYFVNLLESLKQDANITITQHLKLLL